MSLFIDEAIIETRLEAADSAGVIWQMGRKLLDAGLVCDGFVEAVTRREEKYPTSLPTSIPVALCHTDPEFVKQSFIGLATLLHPVPFREMGNPDRTQAVRIVFFLGITDKNEHIDALRSIMKLIQNEGQLRAVYAADCATEIKAILLQALPPAREAAQAVRGG